MKTIDFCNATSEWNCNQFGIEEAWACEPENVVETRETISDFVEARGGGYDLYETEVGDLYVWENQQSRLGKRRGNLFLMDAGDIRYTYFDGQV
jgi:hypothetical protein